MTKYLSADPYLHNIPESLRDNLQRHWQRWREVMGVAQQEPLPERQFADMLRVWACSDFVADAFVQQPEVIHELCRSSDLSQSATATYYQQKLEKGLHNVVNEAQLQQQLRKIRVREMVRIAWRDILGLADIEETLADLSAFADACLLQSYQLLNTWLTELYGAPIDSKGSTLPLSIIAVGKLGGRELNFSSDIDLIFAYPRQGETQHKTNAISNEQYFIRLAQRLIKALNTKTELGFVFRVDMRLRPFGDTGALASSFKALENYYQEQGRGWERYALVKARIINVDDQYQRQLQDILTPFIYRSYVDYGAIEELRKMKRLIEREVQEKALYEDVKRGFGGIRQIEFIVQTFQLIRGGQDKYLQHRHLLTVLNYLKTAKILAADVVEQLRAAYLFLRKVEHCIQMRADQQSQALPSDETEQLRLAFAMDYADWDTFDQQLQKHRQQVAEHFEKMLTQETHQRKTQLKSVDLFTEDLPTKLITIGFDDGDKSATLITDFFQSYRVRQLKETARERLEELFPLLLDAVVTQEQRLIVLHRVINLCEAIIRRSAYLVLLIENPEAIKRLVQLLAHSPWLAEQFSQYPLLLNELIDQDTLYSPDSRENLNNALQQRLVSIPEQELEQQMEALRRFKLSQHLRVAAADVSHVLPLMKVSDHLTFTAETLLHQVFEMAKSQDDVEQTEFAIIAYGKLGGIEMSYASDVDLVFLHGTTQSHQDAYIRLAKRIIHILNTRTVSGELYHVDTRLRPSGSAGLLVSSVDAFREYQSQNAWTWEHQALVRARPICGSVETIAHFTDTRQQVLGQARDNASLREDIITMRERVRESTKSVPAEVFDVKQAPGGITDIEFLVQYGVLAWSKDYPDLMQYTDNIRILEQFAKFGLMTAEQIDVLCDAYQAYRHVVHEALLHQRPATLAAERMVDLRQAVVAIWQQYLIEEKS